MKRLFISGAEAVVRASLSAGCDFFAGYPISPATEIHQRMMRELHALNKTAIQGEDEIASIAMCIAASMAGKKAMTVTSGPGMSLYSENIGLAVMGEVPLVIITVQRLGPATGSATAGAEGDLLFTQWCTPGGLPLPVLGPSGIDSVFTVVPRAFTIAETLRTPVIVLTSKEMITSKFTIDPQTMKQPEKKERNYFQGKGRFVPYRIKDPADVPLFLPIGAKQPVRFTTSMHDENGYLTKDPEIIAGKLQHLEAKISGNSDIIDTMLFKQHENADTMILCYGINAAVCVQAVEELHKKDIHCSLLIIESLFPVPVTGIKEVLGGIRRIVLPELNNGQYSKVLKAWLPGDIELVSVTKYNGELFTVEEITGALI